MKITLKALAQATALHYKVNYDEMLGASRRQYIVEPRHAFYHIAQRNVGHSLSHIGRWMGRDHTSVLHGVRKMEGKVSEFLCYRIMKDAEKLDEIMREKMQERIRDGWGE
jgi:chromosomal replication initiator protein